MLICNYENGDSVKLRHVVTSAIIVKDGKVLLEKRGTFQGRPISESGKWALIGGYLDRDENISEGVKREVYEETGWKIGNLILLHIDDNPVRRHDEDKQNVAFTYIAIPVMENTVNNEEVLELKWFDLHKLPSEEEMAFDHLEELELYKKYLKDKFTLPIIG